VKMVMVMIVMMVVEVVISVVLHILTFIFPVPSGLCAACVRQQTVHPPRLLSAKCDKCL
jgi:hypothetical protein